MNRLRASWNLALALAMSLAHPTIDAAASDRDVERLVREARVFRQIAAARSKLRAAMQESRFMSWWRRAETNPSVRSTTGRLRLAGAAISVAGVTSIVLLGLKPMPVGPLSWAAPLAVACAGVFVSCAADPLARARSGKRA